MLSKKYTIVALLILSLLSATIGYVILSTPAAVEKYSCSPTDQQCNLVYFTSVENKLGPIKALKELANFSKNYPSSISYCHVVAHKLGKLAWDEFKDINTLYTSDSSICSFGYLHGAITRALEGSSVEAMLLKSKNLCDKLNLTSAPAGQECWHGIGHGVVAQAGKVDVGLKVCSSLSDEGYHSCILGAIMEYTAGFGNDYGKSLAETKNLLLLCTNYNEKIAKSCIYSSQPINIRIDSNNGELKKAWDRCVKYSSRYLLECSQGLGAGLPSENSWNVKLTTSSCLSIDTTYADQCIQSAIHTYGNVLMDEKVVKSFCDSITTDEKFKCKGYIDETISELKKRSKQLS